MRVLIVDDKIQNRLTIDLCLKSAGFDTYSAERDDDVEVFAKEYEYDLIVMSADLKKPDSLNILKKLRSFKIQTPILIYTENVNDETEVSMLNSGADDYLAINTASSVIIARAHALIRRSNGQAESCVRFGLLVIDIKNRTVIFGDKSAKIDPAEYKLLEIFVLHANKVVSRDKFLNKIYGERDAPDRRAIDVHVGHIRLKLKALSGGVDYIEAVRGEGYKFVFVETSPKAKPEILKAA